MPLTDIPPAGLAELVELAVAGGLDRTKLIPPVLRVTGAVAVVALCSLLTVGLLTSTIS